MLESHMNPKCLFSNDATIRTYSQHTRRGLLQYDTKWEI